MIIGKVKDKYYNFVLLFLDHGYTYKSYIIGRKQEPKGNKKFFN